MLDSVATAGVRAPYLNVQVTDKCESNCLNYLFRLQLERGSFPCRALLQLHKCMTTMQVASSLGS